MILDNPFRLLGLPATASSHQVHCRLDEPAVVRLDAASRVRIREALDDPAERLRHELLWLHSPATREDLISAAGRPPGPEQAVALHTLAVHATARYEEGGEDASARELFERWLAVCSSDAFWDYIAGRAAGPTGDVVERLREGLPAMVLDPVARRAAALIDTQRLESAAPALAAIRGSGFPGPAVDAAVETAVGPLRLRLHAGTRLVDDAAARLPGAGPTALDEAESLLVAAVLVPYAQLRSLAAAHDTEAAATTVRALALKACELLGEWERGAILLGCASGMTRSEGLAERLIRERARAREELHSQQGAKAAAGDHGAHAAAHFELAADFTTDRLTRDEWHALRERFITRHDLGPHDIEACREAIERALLGRELAFAQRVRHASGGLWL